MCRVSSEYHGMREGRDEFVRQLRKSGASEAEAKKQADAAVRRADARIRSGAQPKPTIRGELKHGGG